MLLMHGLIYGPALTRNTKERASVYQSDKVGLKPTRVTSHTIPPPKVFNSSMKVSMSFIPNCRAETGTITSSIQSIVLETCCFLHIINRSCLNHTTQKYTSLPIRYVVYWTEKDQRNIYQAPMRAKEKHKQLIITKRKEHLLKVALYTIVPLSPFFAFCTPKYCRLQKCD